MVILGGSTAGFKFKVQGSPGGANTGKGRGRSGSFPAGMTAGNANNPITFPVIFYGLSRIAYRAAGYQAKLSYFAAKLIGGILQY